jgi:predicted dehydrogenase
MARPAPRSTRYGAIRRLPASRLPRRQSSTRRWRGPRSRPASMFLSRSRFAITVPEAEQIVELAERRHRRLMVGHLLQYHPAFLKLRELTGEGVLGRLQYLYSNRLNLGKVRREEDILWSFAPHDLSMILSLVGQERTEVTAQRGYYLHKAIADVTTTHLSFPGGEQAHVFVS